jgi:BirA family biotin operon repressor/biotin-[acetyl-CoA-carboxylase] ligase
MSDALPDLRAAVEAARPRLGAYADVTFRAVVDSTNDWALEAAAKGRPEGTAIVAEAQTAGRGRRGHTWFSPAGCGLYVSVVTRPSLEAGDIPFVTLAAGVAVAQAVSRVSALPIELKWPNDLVIGWPWRKCGGILSETSSRERGVDAVVVGIGLNLTPASYPPALAPSVTSIEGELGRPMDRARLLVELLAELKEVMGLVGAGRRDRILDAWRRFGATGLDRAAVHWLDQGIERRGLTRGLDHDGALLVESGGHLERILAGTVTWEQWTRG